MSTTRDGWDILNYVLSVCVCACVSDSKVNPKNGHRLAHISRLTHHKSTAPYGVRQRVVLTWRDNIFIYPPTQLFIELKWTKLICHHVDGGDRCSFVSLPTWTTRVADHARRCQWLTASRNNTHPHTHTCTHTHIYEYWSAVPRAIQ